MDEPAINTLHYYWTIVKIIILTVLVLLNSRLYSDFTNFSTNAHFLLYDPIQDTTLNAAC